MRLCLWEASLCGLLGGLLLAPAAFGSRPSPDQLAVADSLEQARQAQLQAAAPWREALQRAFAGDSSASEGESDSASDSISEQIFRITYKHYTKKNTVSSDSCLAERAAAFAQLLDSLSKPSEQLGVSTVALAEAVYRFTNSDWQPVSMTHGPGLDSVRTPEDFREWAAAALSLARRSRKAGKDPTDVWARWALSESITTAKDLQQATPEAPPPPKY